MKYKQRVEYIDVTTKTGFLKIRHLCSKWNLGGGEWARTKSGIDFKLSLRAHFLYQIMILVMLMAQVMSAGWTNKRPVSTLVLFRQHGHGRPDPQKQNQFFVWSTWTEEWTVDIWV